MTCFEKSFLHLQCMHFSNFLVFKKSYCASQMYTCIVLMPTNKQLTLEINIINTVKKATCKVAAENSTGALYTMVGARLSFSLSCSDLQITCYKHS